MRCLLFVHFIILIKHTTGSIDHSNVIIAIIIFHGSTATFQSKEADVNIFFSCTRMITSEE